jgi:arsenate reductase
MNDTDAREKVLFICKHNSARSQMAEGLMRHLYGGRFEAYSAGTDPTRVRWEAVEAMKEVGIDISGQRPKGLDAYRGERFDYVVTVCEEGLEDCPYFPGGGVNIHESFEDPAALQGSESERLAVYRRVRDEIRAWLAVKFGGKV